jgi:hypothetical protein
VKDTALCGLGQKTAPNPVLSTLRYFRHEYIEHIRDKKCRAGVCTELVYAPCNNSCPASVNVPAYLSYTKEGQYQKAMRAHLRTNPFRLYVEEYVPLFVNQDVEGKILIALLIFVLSKDLWQIKLIIILIVSQSRKVEMGLR